MRPNFEQIKQAGQHRTASRDSEQVSGQYRRVLKAQSIKTRRTGKRSSTILWNQSYNPKRSKQNSRVHRVGKERGKKSSPIIAKFLRYCDREEVLFKARKLSKGKTYSVFEDMPKELYELRKAQLRMRKREVTQRTLVKKYPDKLFINGKCIPLKYLSLSLICQYAKLRKVLYHYFFFSLFLLPPICIGNQHKHIR